LKRPILIITLGFLIGNILGLYLNIAPFIFLILIFITFIIKAIQSKKTNNYIRILNVFLKNNIILVVLISAFLSSIYSVYCNKKYERVYSNFSKTEIIATVVSNLKESEYKNSYTIELKNNKGIKLILRVSKSKNIELKYADKIKVKGEYIIPETSRNYGGFNYKEYLKTEGIYGIFEAEKIEVLENKDLNFVAIFANNSKQKIITNINKVLPEDTKELFLGILIGYDDNLSEEIEISFRKSSLTHLLAVSGSHIAYIITGLAFSLKLLKMPKKAVNIITIIFLILFMYIVDFSPSVVRASIMGIILLFSTILYKENDVLTTISISILLILLENPYKILNIGLLLSYFATIGIICGTKLKSKEKENNTLLKNILNYLKELILITLYANIFVIPITVYNFNTISLTFVISNLIAGILIGPITIGGFILAIVSLMNLKLAYIIGIPYNLLLELLIYSTKLTSIGPFAEIFVPTPNVIVVIFYYLILFLVLMYLKLKNKEHKRFFIRKFLIYSNSFFKYLKKNYKFIISLFILLILIFFILNKIPKDLKIYFIDVGQGDSTLIITPTNKKILIDSGGAETGNFDVGKSTLFPYLLDRGITTIDYICISHFDSDHCDGFKYLLENMKIKNVILSKQYESTSNFEEIMEFAAKKKVNIIKVEAGDILQIDKYVNFKVFSPGEELTDNINDNSIVMKLEYYNFSCLFTGDISNEIEERLVKNYVSVLESTVLKVAHHGSKTSSAESFISTVKPKLALIGVGKNNKFGHPTNEVIEKLEKCGARIYRTDLNGEIILKINKKRRNKS